MVRRLGWLVIAASLTTALPTFTVAQNPEPAEKSSPAVPTKTAESTSADSSTAGYSYSAGGRRDPFVSLMNRGAESTSAGGRRPDGLNGLAIGDITLKGIVRSQGTYVAILLAPDKKTYMVRENDRLFDGMVKSVMPDGVIFLQEVTDPLALTKQREVRLPLRPGGEAQ